MFRQFGEKYSVIFIIGAFLLGIVTAWGLQARHNVYAAAAASEPALSTAQTGDGNDLSGIDSTAGFVWANCTPTNVAVFSERIHVRCQTAVNGILYFAFPTTNDAETARILSLFTSAQVTGRLLQVLYDPADTTTGPAIGCGANDCRVITAVVLN
ncbi:MAG: hypothetical protein D6816_17665 [Bacteroidetes bacterium]|nr:MAG: hypothetical protein D6816_17665 [Bacteroidota bacterium]